MENIQIISYETTFLKDIQQIPDISTIFYTSTENLNSFITNKMNTTFHPSIPISNLLKTWNNSKGETLNLKFPLEKTKTTPSAEEK